MVQLQPSCVACLGTGLVERDSSERVLTNDWSPLNEIVRRFKPCPFCNLGDMEWAFRKSHGLEKEAKAAA